MKIAVILLAVVCAALTFALWGIVRRVTRFYDIVSNQAHDDVEFRRGLKKEMSKLHGLASDAVVKVEKLEARMKELEKQQAEFSELADESVRAQIDSEKAWAEGVRAIAGFGASIPTLNTKGLEHE